MLLIRSSPITLTVLRHVFQRTPSVRVINATHGKLRTLTVVPVLGPALVYASLRVPGVGKLRLARRMVTARPYPVLIIDTSMRRRSARGIFHVLRTKTLSVFPGPQTKLTSRCRGTGGSLLTGIQILTKMSIFARQQHAPPIGLPPACTTPPPPPTPEPLPSVHAPHVLAVNTSANNPRTLLTVFRRLPGAFPTPVLYIRRVDRKFLRNLVS